MWIWKKGSANTASSTTLFRRTQHLQPAAAFPSLLCGLQHIGRRLISQAFFAAAAHKNTHNNKLPGTGFLAFASSAHGTPASPAMQPASLCMHTPYLPQADGAVGVPGVPGMHGMRLAPTGFFSQGRFQEAALAARVFSFMALHLVSGAGPCVVSGSFFVPEVFLVS